MQPWQPLLDWWFGAADATAAEVAASRSALWFGKQDSQDSQARERFGEQVEQALAGQLSAWQADPCNFIGFSVFYPLQLGFKPGAWHSNA